MIALYELIDLLPPNFEAGFAPRLNQLLAFLKKHQGLNERQATQQYLVFKE